jgi:hypothetical protein
VSGHHDFIFPKHPHLPAPDWKKLEQRLLDEEWVIPAVGRDVPEIALRDLHFSLGRLSERHLDFDPTWHTTGDLIAAHVAARALPNDVPVIHDQTVAQAVAMLECHGIALTDWQCFDAASSTWCSAQYRPGPEFIRFLDREIFDPGRDTLAMMLLEFDGDHPFVSAGENTFEPRLPGSGEELVELPPYGTYVDFIGAAYEDLNAQWVDPATGHAYRIHDLDWQGGLGIGRRFLRFNDFDGGDLDVIASELGTLVGQPMAWCRRHL